MKWISVIAVLAMAACGVDGAPERPVAKPKAQPGVSISGHGVIGVQTEL